MMPESCMHHDTATNRFLQQNEYKPGVTLWLQKSDTDERKSRYVVEKCLEGQRGWGFTSAVVLLAQSDQHNFESGEQIVLKIFDHTADTALRRRFVTSPYSMDTQQVLEEAYCNGSLQLLWEKMCSPIDLTIIGGKITRKLIEEQSLSSHLSYGELVCRHVIMAGPRSESLKEELTDLGIIPLLAEEYRIKCYYLWLRVMFHSEVKTAKSLATHTVLPRFDSCAFVEPEHDEHLELLRHLYNHPVMMLEYIDGSPLDRIESVFRNHYCSSGEKKISSDLAKQNIPQSDSHVEHILQTILSAMHRLLDEGFYYDDFHGAQVLVQNRASEVPVVRLVDYGAIRPILESTRINVSPEWLSIGAEKSGNTVRSCGFVTLSPVLDIADDFEEEIEKHFASCCYAFKGALARFRQNINIRFRSQKRLSTTFCWHLLIEDVRRGALQAGCDAATVMMAVCSASQVLAHRFNTPEPELGLLIADLDMLFTGSGVVSKDTVNERAARLQDHVFMLLLICYLRSGRLPSPHSNRGEDGVFDWLSITSLDDNCPDPEEISLLYVLQSPRLQQLVEQSCWTHWRVLFPPKDKRHRTQEELVSRVQTIIQHSNAVIRD